MSAHAGALEAVERIVNRGGEASDVRDAVTGVLRERLGFTTRFEDGGLVIVAGPDEPTAADRATLDRVALLTSPYVG